jgi:hypothetical protein
MEQFHTAIKNRNIDKIKDFILNKLYDKPRSDLVCLKLSAIYGRYDIFKFLVESGYTPQRGIKDYALKWAAVYGQLSIVKYLVDTGYDYWFDNNYVFRHAVANGRIIVAKYLSTLKFCDPRANDNFAIKKAIENNDVGMIDYLCSLGCDWQNSKFSKTQQRIIAQRLKETGESNPILQTVLQDYGDAHVRLVEICVNCEHFNILKYLVKVGHQLKVKQDFIDYALLTYNFEIMKYLFLLGFVPSALCVADFCTHNYESFDNCDEKTRDKMRIYSISIFSKRDRYTCFQKIILLHKCISWQNLVCNLTLHKICYKNNALKFVLKPKSLHLQMILFE